MLLAIDTSTRFAGVALADVDQVVACRAWRSRTNHSAELMPAAAQILKDHDTPAAALSGIAVALGPGGFSALRVGLSVAKGLAATCSLPLVGVGTLELEAFPYLGSGMPVCAMVEAGRGEVAAAVFGAEEADVSEERIWPPEELLELFSEPTIFCGEGAAARVSLIRERLGKQALIVDPAVPPGRLWSLAAIGWQRIASGDIDEPAGLQPNYLRMPSIGVAKRRDHTTQAS